MIITNCCTIIELLCDVCYVGAPKAVQHPDHTDREGEHGARGEGES